MHLPFSLEDWPAEALEDWAERAAIIEFEARRNRKDAERLAEEIVRANYARKKD